MHPSHPASDLWDWPMTRIGQAAMALLGLAFVVPLITPLAMLILPFGQEDESVMGWIVLPLLVAGAIALLSGLLALVAMVFLRERSLYLGFAILGGLIALSFAV